MEYISSARYSSKEKNLSKIIAEVISVIFLNQRRLDSMDNEIKSGKILKMQNAKNLFGDIEENKKSSKDVLSLIVSLGLTDKNFNLNTDIFNDNNMSFKKTEREDFKTQRILSIVCKSILKDAFSKNIISSDFSLKEDNFKEQLKIDNGDLKDGGKRAFGFYKSFFKHISDQFKKEILLLDSKKSKKEISNILPEEKIDNVKNIIVSIDDTNGSFTENDLKEIIIFLSNDKRNLKWSDEEISNSFRKYDIGDPVGDKTIGFSFVKEESILFNKEIFTDIIGINFKKGSFDIEDKGVGVRNSILEITTKTIETGSDLYSGYKTITFKELKKSIESDFNRETQIESILNKIKLDNSKSITSTVSPKL